MTTEYDKYQNIKKTILLVAWKQIEDSHLFSTSVNEIKRDLKELVEKFDLSFPQLSKLLSEIVTEDKWLNYEKDSNGETNRNRYVMRPNGRQEIDEIMKTKAQKTIEWLKVVAPKVATFVLDSIVKPYIQSQAMKA